MKKNIVLILSMLLISSMFLSMFYVALFGKEETVEEGLADQTGKNLQQNLRINISKEPSTLHPGLAADPTSISVLLQTFEGLTRIDLWGQTVNAAAKVVKISEDQKTYTFTLRDAKWSNGDPVIAKDFEYAWKWALDPSNHSNSAYQLYYIEGAREFNNGKGSANNVGVKAIDDKTLEVKLVNPTPYFLELTALPTYFPINSIVAEENPKWASELGVYSSNGPFKMTEWLHNERIVLKKSDNYWDLGPVKLKSITMFMVDDPISELSMFEKGELDWAGSPIGHMPIDGVQEFVDVEMLNSQSVEGNYIYQLNNSVEPFNNVNMRKAFALAINRKEIIDSIAKLGLTPATAIVPPTLIPENDKGYFKDYDVKNAKEYLQKGLEELGHTEASELPPITLSVNTNEGHEEIALAIQKMWNENLGVNVTLNNSSGKENSDNIQILDYEVAETGWIGEFNDPYHFLKMYGDSNSINNSTGWENNDFRSLLLQAQNETDENKRLEILKKAEDVLMSDMPVIPIYFYSNYWLQNEDLQGVAISGLSHIQFKWAYFEKKQN
ncbi:oligopeptide transport system substrate-binding protein [Neobacillus niacini]|uniref:peptide ABC transporter substrate-binding protein n=1 Tax=Neobacillus niacini TaxID=86668 RepID=UPI00285782C5|nr:peptide ABC transporter substrate-binding protein [Neobacillus niacini]MDR7078838.1 oligopeptide transport system substrate-binding protein [Neobacillus niacini]